MMTWTARSTLWLVLITMILIAYQLVRIIAFIDVYGGIEHDGGWMLSISRSLAETGTYTTLVSTIADPNVPGDINVDQKFDIQAADGRIWFFTGNGIGPASIIPDALALKLFGTGFWALRAGPLIFFTLFLLLTAYLLYELAGIWAIILFHAYLFFYPHLSIFLSYEAMGEVPAMLYIIWAYLAFAAVTLKPQRRPLHFFLAGLVISLALNAKLITLWSISGILLWAGLLWLFGLIRQRRMTPDLSYVEVAAGPSVVDYPMNKVSLGELIWLGLGTASLVIVWELVHLIVLTSLTSFDLYLRHAQQRLTFILDDGSGVGLQIHSGPQFFWDKFFILSEVAHPARWVTALLFVAIFLGGLSLAWLWRRQPWRQNLLMPMWLGWLANTAWFVGLAKTGWPRHFWFGLVLAILLLCVIIVTLLRIGVRGQGSGVREQGAGSNNRQSSIVNRQSSIGGQRSAVSGRLPAAGGLLLLALVLWGFAVQPHVWGFFLPDAIVPYWHEKQITNKYDASLPWIIIPRQAQTEVVNYINQLPPEAHLYYPGQHKSAEIPPQTGRIQLPLNRREYLPPNPADIVLIGPSLISPWKDPTQRRDLLELVRRQCPNPAVQNDYYMICPIKDNLPAE
ncbi:MAG: hypothetical protein H6631_14350 [Anaerolineaceae bacterium]|nr:hypothetical protein [Anaerolineaceae bacterium]